VNGVLLRLSLAAGTIVALASFFLAILRGTSVSGAVSRASIAMLIATVTVALFFRCFTTILYRFVAQRIAEESAAEGGEESAEEQKQEGAAPDRPPPGKHDET